MLTNTKSLLLLQSSEHNLSFACITRYFGILPNQNDNILYIPKKKGSITSLKGELIPSKINKLPSPIESTYVNANPLISGAKIQFIVSLLPRWSQLPSEPPQNALLP